MSRPCLICEKHHGRGPLVGPPLFADDLVVVTHRPAGDTGFVPGYLFIESRRHATDLGSLTAAEAARTAQLARVCARALQVEPGTDKVFTFVAGQSVDHFHQHLFVRTVGTPAEVAWHESWSWIGAPRISAGQATELFDRLRARLGESGS